MLLRKIINTRPLQLRTQASLIIYLRDHNKHINPKNSKLDLSYINPKKYVQGAPTHKIIDYKLHPEMQQVLDRQIFEQYKNKILRGIVDEVKVKEPDPLWGEDPVPKHYFGQMSKLQLMKVSHPQNNDVQYVLRSHYQPYFTTTFQSQITLESIKSSDIHQLVEISVAARKSGLTDSKLWFKIQEGLSRGKKNYLLSSDELIKLKWAFDGLNKQETPVKKQGTPLFHQILASLLREDIPKMNKDQLVHLFYASQYSQTGFNNIQSQVIQHLRPFFKSFTFEEKCMFLLAFSVCTKPTKHNKKVQKRRRYEFKQLAGSVLLELDLWDLSLNNETTSQLVFALAKLHLQNTKFISYPLRDYISQNIESYGSDLSRLYQAIVYLPELQAGEGVMDQELASKLRDLAVSRWSQFAKIQQIRIVHSLWNLGLMDEPLLQLYKGIELEADTTLLFYASQIELNTSSQREWQIIKLLTQIDYLPLPYFTIYKRFFNYIKATTNWNLTPLAEKLRNVQYYYNVMRQYDSLLRVRSYRKLREFQKFSGLHFAQFGSPIHNVELSHFSAPINQVSLDFVSKKQFIPGTSKFKQTYMNKVRSLKNLGWKHLVFSEDQLKDLNLTSIIANIQKFHLPYVEAQQAIIDYADYKLAEEIEIQKQIQEMKEWQLQDLNKYLSYMEGKEYIELGENLQEDQLQGLENEKEKEQYRKLKKQFKQS